MNPQSSRRDPLGISGTVIADKYRMAHAVGEGGFSVVYLAEHTIWRQPVAIKCFKVLANAPEDQRDRLLEGFIQEGKIMASLSSRSAAIVRAIARKPWAVAVSRSKPMRRSATFTVFSDMGRSDRKSVV